MKRVIISVIKYAKLTHCLEIFIGLDERCNKRPWEHGKPLLSAETCRNGTQDVVQQILPCVYGSS
jgi:hypothetical protein